jgi:hypothetical protein
MARPSADPIGEEQNTANPPIQQEHLESSGREQHFTSPGPLDPLVDNAGQGSSSPRSSHGTKAAEALTITFCDEIYFPGSQRETWYSFAGPEGEPCPERVYIFSHFSPCDPNSLENSLVKDYVQLDRLHPSYRQLFEERCELALKERLRLTLSRLLEVAIREHATADAFGVKNSKLKPRLRPGFSVPGDIQGLHFVRESELEFVSRIDHGLDLVRASPRRDTGPLESGRLYVLKSAKFQPDALSLEMELENYLRLRSLNVTPHLFAILATTDESRAFGLVL